MAMKKWRFFPILVKEKILAYMFIPDIVSFAKCSKKCQNLLTFVPIHLSSAFIDDRFYHQAFLDPRLTLNLDLISLVHFSILATSRKFYVDELKICVTTDECKHDLKNLIETLTEERKSLKVKELSMDIKGEHAGFITGILSVCDPSCIEAIEIPKLYSQEVYDEIVKTPQWKNCKKVILNDMLSNLKVTMPDVNIDDFLHFKTVHLAVETLSIEESDKLIQIFQNATELIDFHIRCRKPMQDNLILQKIKTGWTGNCQQTKFSNEVFVIDRARPDRVFEFMCSSFSLQGGWSLLDDELRAFIEILIALQ